MARQQWTRRATLTLAVCALSACGETTAATSPSTHQSASPAPSVAASGSAASDFVISTSSLPAHGQSWQQIADQPLNGNGDSDQRGWQNMQGTQRVEIDVLLESSTSAAQSYYSTWAADSRNTVATTSGAPACPGALSGVASCAETTGATSSGAGVALITWQTGRVLAATVVVNTSGAADSAYLDAVASVENSQISSLVGG